MTDFDIVAGLRSRSAWFKREDIAEVLENAANEIDRLNDKVSFVCGDLALQEIDRLRKENEQLRKERDEARRLYCRAVEEIEHGMTNETERMVADYLGWDCFNTPEGKLDKTMNGVIVDGGKAVPPKYEDLGDE